MTENKTTYLGRLRRGGYCHQPSTLNEMCCSSSRRTHVHCVDVCQTCFNLVPRREEGVETHNQIRMTLEESWHSTNYSWCVDPVKIKDLNPTNTINNLSRMSLEVLVWKSKPHFYRQELLLPLFGVFCKFGRGTKTKTILTLGYSLPILQ